MSNKNFVMRYKHELILTLLVILTASVICLLIIVKNQNQEILTTHELISELADEKFTDVQ